MKGRRPAFTLIEILVAFGVVAVLLAIALPALGMAREAARRVGCQNNLKQIALASLQTEATFRRFPQVYFDGAPGSSACTKDHGWLVEILPHVDPVLADRWHLDAHAYAAVNREVFGAEVGVYVCPSSGGAVTLAPIAERFGGGAVRNTFAVTADYQGNGGFQDADVAPARRIGAIRDFVGGISKPSSSAASVRDGLSQTMLCWESSGTEFVKRLPGGKVETASWEELYGGLLAFTGFSPTLSDELFRAVGPADSKAYFRAWAGMSNALVFCYDANGKAVRQCATDGSGRALNVSNILGQPFSYHPGVVNVALLDGSVRALPDATDLRTVLALSSADGGETLRTDW